ncbi:MAG: MFS transporter [Bdellovibrionales bacterium]|nr:MFS transporter [Bdellovibrionales bacterium]
MLNFKQRVLIFHVLFFGSMYFSKTIHPIYFEEQGTLTYFGLSYAAMAVAGALSPFFGKLLLRYSTHRMGTIATFCYVIGLSTRVYAHSKWIAIFSGFVAGVGASSLLLLSRYWVYAFEEDERKEKLSQIEVFSNLAQGLGVIASVYMVFIFEKYSHTPYVCGLLFSAGILALSLFIFPKMDENSVEKNHVATIESPSILSVIRAYPALSVVFSSLILLQGIYTGMFVPFIPVLLKTYGIEIRMIGSVIAFGTLLGGMMQMMGKTWLAKKREEWMYLLSCILIAVLTYYMLSSLSVIWIFAIFTSYSVMRVIARLFLEMMKVRLVPKHHAPILFGLFSTAFLSGDMLGGYFGSKLFELSDLLLAQRVLPVLFIFSAIFVFLFYRKNAAFS